jgi:hypothetical protein
MLSGWMDVRASPKVEQTTVQREVHQAPTLRTGEPLQLEDKLHSNVRSSSSARISINNRLRRGRLSHEVMQKQNGDDNQNKQGNIAQSKGSGYSERP